MLVHSKPAHFERRQIIRDTWGSVSQIEGRRIKVLFLIGNFPSSDLTVQPINTSKTSKIQERTVQEPKSMNFDERITVYNPFYGIINSLKGYKHSTVKSNLKPKFSNRLAKERTILRRGNIKSNQDKLIPHDHLSQAKQTIDQQEYQVLQNDVLEEHSRFDDIIQGHFTDNEKNSIHKHLLGYKV